MKVHIIVVNNRSLNYYLTDFIRQKYRLGVKGDMMPHHYPQRTLHAMRILAGIEDQEERINLSKAFYKVSFHI